MSEYKIAIVDDELSMRKHLQMMLGELGYVLEAFNSGQELFDNLDRFAPDLVILDVVMPDMDGFQVCQQLKSGKWHHVPVILVTVLDAKKVLMKGTEVGADDFLQKPVNKLELQARVRSMLRIKSQYDELEATMRLREELSSMVIHDMSSPIISILLHTTLLQEQISDPEQRKHLELVRIAADRLDSFVNDMLVMAKMEQTKLLAKPTKLDVVQVAHEAQKHFGIIAESKGITLDISLPPHPIEVSVDGNLFQRVVANLLANALQYSPNDTTVRLVMESTAQGGLRMQVLDQGPGIPEEDRKRIFNKFEVVALKKKGVRQIGLGLTFCKMVVDAHGGTIYVTANQPQGSIFVVEI